MLCELFLGQDPSPIIIPASVAVYHLLMLNPLQFKQLLYQISQKIASTGMISYTSIDDTHGNNTESQQIQLMNNQRMEQLTTLLKQFLAKMEQVVVNQSTEYNESWFQHKFPIVVKSIRALANLK